MLRLTAAVSFGGLYIAPLLTKFLARHPNVQMSLMPNRRLTPPRVGAFIEFLQEFFLSAAWRDTSETVHP